MSKIDHYLSTPSKPPRSRKQSELQQQLSTFANTIARDPGQYNLGKAESDEIRAAIGAYLRAYLPGTAPGCKSQSTVRGKNDARRKAEKVHSKYYNLIRNDPGVRDEDKIVIGVKLLNLKRSRIHVPPRVPEVAVVMAQEKKHTLKFSDVSEAAAPRKKGQKTLSDKGREAVRGKPHGAAFFQLYVAIGQGKDQPLSAAREVGLFTKNPVVVPHMEENNGKQAVYWGRWISPTGKAGEWSRPATMAIAA